MTLGSTKLIEKIYRADEATPSNLLASSVAASTAAQDADGFKLTASGAGTGHYHLGDKLFYNIDRLVSVEFLFKVAGLSATNQRIEMGMVSTYNADVTTIANRVLLRSSSTLANGGYRMEAFADDGVKETNDLDTGIDIKNDNWYRAGLNFKSGVQTVSVPGDSLPGKSSIQWWISDDSAANTQSFKRKTSLSLQTAHLDMSGYSGGLQPVIGYVSNGSGPIVTVGEIIVKYQQEQ